MISKQIKEILQDGTRVQAELGEFTLYQLQLYIRTMEERIAAAKVSLLPFQSRPIQAVHTLLRLLKPILVNYLAYP